jgi:plastocyanin
VFSSVTVEYYKQKMLRTPVFGTFVTLGLTCVASQPAARSHGATGVIEGRVTFEGTPPAPTAVIEAGSFQPILYVDRTGGLQYVVVFLPDARGSGNPVKSPATMNQRQFVFEPQVLAVRAGQPVRFTNDDPANHNVRSTDSNPANAFNIFTGSGTVEPAIQQFVATPPNRPLQLSCDIHASMVAWIYVFDHGQFAVTTAGGGFRMEGVPSGRHRLAVRQPAGKLERDLAVDVKPGETARIDVRFTSADLGMPSR